MYSIGDRVKNARKKTGLTQRALADAVGYGQAMISHVESGRKKPTYDQLQRIAVALKVSAGWLAGYSDDPSPQDDDRASYVSVAQEQVLAGISGGNLAFALEGEMPFRRYRLEEEDIDPQKARVYRVTGDSMLPTLPSGSSVLVDLNRTRLLQGRIYVFRTNGDLFVKRARKYRARWFFDSDNANWAPIPWADTMTVLGQVRWYCSDYLG